MTLRSKLTESLKRNSAEALLFSGGLDTSILAAVSRGSIMGINVSLEEHSVDIEYAKVVEKFLNMKVYYLRIKTEEALKAIPETIKILKSFDPAIPNDLAIYFGLKFAKELGFKNVMTGDGADELFAGYEFMKNIKNLNSYIRKIAEKMYFSSNELGEYFAIEIKQPYMDEEFIEFAINEIPIELKIKKQNQKIYGKWLLRKAFEDILPHEIIWQDKRPIEYGSGMTKLREIINKKISDEEFKNAKETIPIKFINKEHLYYYKIYKNLIGEIPKAKDGEDRCLGCGCGLSLGALHCKICGYTKSEVI